MRKIEDDLCSTFEIYYEVDYDKRYDSLRPQLKQHIKEVLTDSTSFDYPFSKLSEHVRIITSKDKKVRLFSWDELTGGSWHDMAVIAQFITKDQKVKAVFIDSDISEEGTVGLTSAIQYELHEVLINNKTYYMCFGWGTFGSGHHHNSILIFDLENDTINPCETCISESYKLIQAPRATKINLAYDEVLKQLSFNEFLYDDDIGFYQPTGKQVVLKLKNGTFIKIN
ncbi:MAG: hypothetical protein ACWA5P_10950 [bacterium]